MIWALFWLWGIFAFMLGFVLRAHMDVPMTDEDLARIVGEHVRAYRAAHQAEDTHAASSRRVQ